MVRDTMEMMVAKELISHEEELRLSAAWYQTQWGAVQGRGSHQSRHKHSRSQTHGEKLTSICLVEQRRRWIAYIYRLICFCMYVGVTDLEDNRKVSCGKLDA